MNSEVKIAFVYPRKLKKRPFFNLLGIPTYKNANSILAKLHYHKDTGVNALV